MNHWRRESFQDGEDDDSSSRLSMLHDELPIVSRMMIEEQS